MHPTPCPHWCSCRTPCERCKAEEREAEIMQENEEMRKQTASFELHEALKNFARAHNITLEDAATAVHETFKYRYMPDELNAAGVKQYESYNK